MSGGTEPLNGSAPRLRKPRSSNGRSEPQPQVEPEPSRGTRSSAFLGALGLLAFANVLTSLAAVPLLVPIAQEFDVTSGIAGLLVAAYGLPTAILGDRVGHKLVAAGSIAFAGTLLLIETSVRVGLAFAVIANLLVSTAAGARLASNSTLLSEQVPGARGSLFALNSSVVALGIVAASSLGGFALDRFDFEGIGMLCGGGAAASALVVLIKVREPVVVRPRLLSS